MFSRHLAQYKLVFKSKMGKNVEGDMIRFQVGCTSSKLHACQVYIVSSIVYDKIDVIVRWIGVVLGVHIHVHIWMGWRCISRQRIYLISGLSGVLTTSYMLM